MKLRNKGKIKELNHIIITDPSYDESVTCRYEKNNLKEKDWYVDIDIKPTIEKIENFTIKGTEFFVIGRIDGNLSLPAEGIDLLMKLVIIRSADHQIRPFRILRHRFSEKKSPLLLSKFFHFPAGPGSDYRHLCGKPFRPLWNPPRST